MEPFWVIMAIISVLWTVFTTMYTTLYIVRQISIATDAVHTMPDRDSYWYLFNWQTWTHAELIRYLVRHYFRFWALLPFLSAAIAIICIIMAVIS